MAQGAGHERFHPQFRVSTAHDLDSNDYVVLDYADLNNDGYPEMLYSDPYYQEVGGRDFDAGRVIIYDGKTGAQLFEMHGPGTGALLGVTAHFLDDITGDGIPDISLTDQYQFAYHLHLLSGADFSPLIDASQHDRFYEVISIGDRTGDGLSELAAVRYSNPFGATVEILDGSDLSMIERKSTRDVSINLIRLGDLDGDGLEEVGTFRRLAVIDEDRSQVLRGANLRTMQRFAPEVRDFSLLANAGDVDADGVNDVFASHTYWDHLGIENSGLVKVISGATGDILALHYGQVNDHLGGFMNTLGDLNGDGHSEYLLGSEILAQGGSYGSHPQEVRIFSGATHAPLDYLFGRDVHFGYGDKAIAIYPATSTQTAFIGLANSFRRNFASPMVTVLHAFRFGS
ncbi:MAG: hypothetical protein COA70_08960 [Planctomycetota bacterium]|nr:MAG: hypothetical protein COA70_08960 [Planctomycetota bacterium]